MIRRALLISALTVTAAAAFAPSTLAQTVDVPFNGTVPGLCSFGQPTAGTLGMGGSTGSTASGGGYYGGPSGPTALGSRGYGGAFGQVAVSCNQSARVTVSKPVQTAGPSFTPIYSSASINSSAGSTDSNGASPLSLPIGGYVTLDIDMIVDKGTPLTAGNYSYVTTLTIVP